MAIIDYYPATLAVDANGTVVRGAEAQVFALADTALANPLPLTDIQGVPMNTLSSSDAGIFPPFRIPSGVMQVVVVSGELRTPMTSLSVYASAAEAAASIASGNAGAAADSAAVAMTAADRARQIADDIAAVATPKVHVVPWVDGAWGDPVPPAGTVIRWFLSFPGQNATEYAGPTVPGVTDFWPEGDLG